MNNVPVPADQLEAYRTAGHAVMARELGLPCEVPDDDQPRFRFGTLGDCCRQGSESLPLVAVRNYVRFLLAGPAAELLRLERHHGIDHRSPGRTRFRRHFLLRLQTRPDPALDRAFSIVLGWFGGGRQRNGAEVFDDHWNAAIEAYQYPTLWKEVEQVAQRILCDNDKASSTSPE